MNVACQVSKRAGHACVDRNVMTPTLLMASTPLDLVARLAHPDAHPQVSDGGRSTMQRHHHVSGTLRWVGIGQHSGLGRSGFCFVTWKCT